MFKCETKDMPIRAHAGLLAHAWAYDGACVMRHVNVSPCERDYMGSGMHVRNPIQGHAHAFHAVNVAFAFACPCIAMTGRKSLLASRMDRKRSQFQQTGQFTELN